MVESKQVRDWVESDIYDRLLRSVVRILNFNVNDEDVSDVLLKYDAMKFNAAEVQPFELSNIAEDADGFCRYISKKLKIIQGTENEQEGKHQEDEDDVVLAVNPFYRNFLNIYLLEFYILKNKPEDLDGYLKSIRIPNSKKYASQLRVAFKSM